MQKINDFGKKIGGAKKDLWKERNMIFEDTIEMTEAEKRKYVAAKLLESIAPYGYFLRYGAIWKYSMDGKYVVCISFHLGRIGDLVDIYIGFGSFFAPLEINEYVKHCLALSSMGLAYYVRNAGLGSPLLDIHLTFEEQVASILPYFQNIIFPCLPKNDDLNDYMHKAEQFMHLSTTAFDGVPYDVDIKEVAYAYLSLNHPEEALRAVSQYAAMQQTKLLLMQTTIGMKTKRL